MVAIVAWSRNNSIIYLVWLTDPKVIAIAVMQCRPPIREVTGNGPLWGPQSPWTPSSDHPKESSQCSVLGFCTVTTIWVDPLTNSILS